MDAKVCNVSRLHGSALHWLACITSTVEAGSSTTGVLHVVLTCTIGGWLQRGWAWLHAPNLPGAERMDAPERVRKVL